MATNSIPATFNGLIDSDLITNSNIGLFTPESSNNVIKDFHSHCNLSIFHVNIRSINANYMKLLDLLDIYNHKFDLILLSEIWSTNLTFFDNIFPKYKFIPCPPSIQKAGGVQY